MTSRSPRIVPTMALLTSGALILSACSGEESENGQAAEGTTITLAGPNQWNSNPDSFGPAWDDLIADFEEETGIVVETTVLPVDQFAQTLATQLSAGTAPELVFNQAPHEPEMVTALNDYLEQPNPYIEGNERWWDAFVEDKYGPDIALSVNAEGNTEFVPFNLVATGIFVNAEAMSEAGIETPITTWNDLMSACGALKQGGYTPFAMDNSDLGLGWTVQVISNMMFAKYYDDLNVYAADGSEGSSPQLVPKDWARAVMTDEISATGTPETAETLRLLKEFYDTCATENWSGIAPSGGGSVIGLEEFVNGDAAMAWGVNFGYSALEDAAFEIMSMPFPTVGPEASELSTGFEAQYGASTGGTSYMIPANIEGDQLDAAVAFLQFISAPEHVEPWLQATGGIPALAEAEAAPAVAGFADGAWGEQMLTGGMPGQPIGETIQSLYDGFLLGERDLPAQLDFTQEKWLQSTRQAVEDNGWEEEEWAQ